MAWHRRIPVWEVMLSVIDYPINVCKNLNQDKELRVQPAVWTILPIEGLRCPIVPTSDHPSIVPRQSICIQL
jgi:hypothetical protein